MTEKDVTKLKGNEEKERDGEGHSEIMCIQCSQVQNYQKYFKIQ